MDIFSPNDEIDYWENVEASSSNHLLKERAQFYNQKFAKLAKYYKDLNAIELPGLKEVEGRNKKILRFFNIITFFFF